MSAVVLDSVSKAYANGTVALRDLSLTVAPGELIVLVGPSASGKTTTLRVLAGLEEPTSGAVRIAGRDVTYLPPHRRDVALVFQRPALYPHLTVAANLAFGLTVRSWAPWRWAWPATRLTGPADHRVHEVAIKLGLSDVLDRRPAELSGGQQQRVALGRALVRAPAVYLLDEPLSGLDGPLRLEMRRELHLLHRSFQATMMHVTHDQEEALALGDRVVVLDRGTVQQADRPRVLLQRPANRFVAAFLGAPPMSFLDGQLLEVEGRLQFVAERGAAQLEVGLRPDWRAFLGGVTVGIRPEHVKLGAFGPGDARLVMEVRLVERSGSAFLVSLQREGWSAQARCDEPARANVIEGVSVEVGLTLTQAHLFDSATGCALTHGLGPG
jgi:multiple sugar transport system ATP-binding protein